MLKTFLYTLAIAVVLGAFGAHALKNLLTSEQLETWKTAVLYHFLHAIGGIVLCLLSTRIESNQKRLYAAQVVMMAGIVLFSGSLYLLTLRHIWSADYLSFLGPVTPLGGVCFVLAWAIAALSVGKPGANQ
jgi:uncharacterized membrane protein YgdD (TMEM256/DUF423 family)